MYNAATMQLLLLITIMMMLCLMMMLWRAVSVFRTDFPCSDRFRRFPFFVPTDFTLFGSILFPFNKIHSLEV